MEIIGNKVRRRVNLRSTLAQPLARIQKPSILIHRALYRITILSTNPTPIDHPSKTHQTNKQGNSAKVVFEERAAAERAVQAYEFDQDMRVTIPQDKKYRCVFCFGGGEWDCWIVCVCVPLPLLIAPG